jgi:hypothetical protein
VSFKAIQWAMKQKLPAMQKMVLVTLANRFNDDTGDCYPSHELLAKESGMSKRSVLYQIEKLELLKLMTVIRSTKENGVKDVNHYLLNFGVDGSATDALHDATDALEVVQDVRRGGARAAHETVNEPVNITTTYYARGNSEKIGSKLNALHREVFEWACTDSYWVKCTNSEEDFLRAYCSPKGGMRRQFDEFKKMGGKNNATRQQPSKKLSAVERAELANPVYEDFIECDDFTTTRN